MKNKYFALSIILSLKPEPKDKRLLEIFKIGKTYKAFYEIDEEDQGWFVPPQKHFDSLMWLTPKDGSNRSDFRREAYIMDNFHVVKAAGYEIGEDKTTGFNLL